MKKFLIAVLFSCMILSAGNAHAFLTDWQFDADGAAGSGSAVRVNEYMDLLGNAYIQIDPSNPNNITFQENGVFMSPTHDGYGTYTGSENQITATLSGASGLLNPQAGTFGFASGGILNIYSDGLFDYGQNTDPGVVYGADNGTLIGTFILSSGGGIIDPISYVPNGQITASFTANYLASGYWFDEYGKDLTTYVDDALVLGFATTNGSALENLPENLQNEMDEWLGIATVNQVYDPEDPQPLSTFYVSNNGQYRLDVVPEPTSMLLFGSGLVGMALRRKKRS